VECCDPKNSPPSSTPNESHHHSRRDWILIVFGTWVAVAYVIALITHGNHGTHQPILSFSHSVFELINTMWWGVLVGVLFVGLLNHIPREFIISMLGSKRGLRGLLRATLMGVLLDMCSHGILLVGMKLYERGASIGQTMAFLIASPWNSLSLTLILVSLIGLKWTLCFIALSAVVGLITGAVLDLCVSYKILPDNPNTSDLPTEFHFFREAKKQLKGVRFNMNVFINWIRDGFVESRPVLKWIFFGTVLASLGRAFIDVSSFQNLFGPTWKGLGLTLLSTTIIEVCSEGATPLAADLVLRAHALGNAFVLLMAGVSTDYTEIMALRETTKSWKLALFLPLVSVPQIVVLGYFLNQFSH
jgi:uncharacterized membrane protein YraQ (UPF0718 family)